MYYLYKRPDNRPELTSHQLTLDIFPGYALVKVLENEINTNGMIFDEHDDLVRELIEPEYVTSRRYAYPPIADQMDAMWHAMDKGLMQKIEPFYTQIKTVKEIFPKL